MTYITINLNKYFKFFIYKNIGEYLYIYRIEIPISIFQLLVERELQKLIGRSKQIAND